MSSPPLPVLSPPPPRPVPTCMGTDVISVLNGPLAAQLDVHGDSWGIQTLIQNLMGGI